LSVLEIKSHIEKETETEIRQILQEAEAEAHSIIENAKKKVAAILEEHKQKRTFENLAKERSELAILRMTQKAELTKVKAGWLDRAFEEAEKRLSDFMKDTRSPAHKDFLTGLVVEGAIKMSGSRFVVLADSQVSGFLKKTLKSISKRISEAKGGEIELQLTSKPNTPAGVILQSADRRQYYNNTLEARLSATRQRLGGELYSLLFREGE